MPGMGFKSSSGRSSSGSTSGRRVARDPDSCYNDGSLFVFPNKEIRSVIYTLNTTIPIVIKKIDKNGTKTYLMREPLGAVNTLGNFTKSNNKVVSPILTACSFLRAHDKANYRYASDASTWSGQSRGYRVNWDKSTEQRLKLSDVLDYFKTDNNMLQNIQKIEDFLTRENKTEDDKSKIHLDGIIMMNGQIDEETNTQMPDGPAFFVVIEKKTGGKKTRKTRKTRKTNKTRKTRK